ncbi:ComF family protein [Hamadaea tsunoensis]|uniref:ComF family protein n=1 Tax=Hamadaea tsunoensis TaxID=53368 RepID=UPI001B7F967D|nr:phosphoribosyltransferase family protein [Hamadaea tsunoensis]
MVNLVPHETRPTPAPAGLPPCHALGAYADPLRSLVLAYKDRGRHGLARPLGNLLAAVVASASADGVPVLLIPIPDTPAAARERHGDHMARLARTTVRALRANNIDARWAYALKGLKKADSAHLSAVERAAAARNAFAPRGRRPAADRRVILVDDVLTTGATLAAAAGVLRHAGVAVAACATLAATRRKDPGRGCDV